MRSAHPCIIVINKYARFNENVSKDYEDMGRHENPTDGQTDKVITIRHPPTSSGGALKWNTSISLKIHARVMGLGL